jgi:hypothetical protein
LTTPDRPPGAEAGARDSAAGGEREAPGVQEFVPEAIRLTEFPILRFHGYRAIGQAAPPIREAAQEMITAAERLIDPRVVFLRRGIERVDRETLALAGGPTFRGSCFATHLSHAHEVVCFVATLGPALDERAEALADAGDLLEAVFLEAAGWLAIEKMLRAFRGHLAAQARPARQRLSPRLGPGFLDWALTEQRALFSAFGGAPLPVSVSEYSVMTPKKSISGLFGFLPAGSTPPP